MNGLLPPDFWIIFGILAAALAINMVFPPLAVILGIVAAVLMFRVIFGGGP